MASIQLPGISVPTLSLSSYGLSRSGEVHPHQAVWAGRPREQSEHVHVCARMCCAYAAPRPTRVCVCNPGAAPGSVQSGGGDRGQSEGAREGGNRGC